MMKTVLKIVLPLLVLVIGVGVAIALIKSRPKAKRQKPTEAAMLVQVRDLAPVTRRAQVVGMGTVVPDRVVTLQPEVSGLLVHASASLQEGGRFARGEVVARVDDRDYRLALKQRKADVTRARFEVSVEQGRGLVAASEWKLLNKDIQTNAHGRALALRKPHLEAAQAMVGAAESALERAQLSVERTTVKAPFDAVVQSRRASLGQLVSPQTPLATLVATDRFLVQVSVPYEQLAAIDVPGLNGERGAPAIVVQQTGSGAPMRRKGRVLRLLGELDPQGRMARLMVAVEDPLGPSSALDARPGQPPLPLLLGAYVEVMIEGRELPGVYDIPRLALREGGQVWLAGSDDKLRVQPVQVAWRVKDSVLVDGGLSEGDRLIVSPIPSPVPGMALRVRASDAKARTAAREPSAASAEATP